MVYTFGVIGMPSCFMNIESQLAQFAAFGLSTKQLEEIRSQLETDALKSQAKMEAAEQRYRDSKKQQAKAPKNEVNDYCQKVLRLLIDADKADVAGDTDRGYILEKKLFLLRELDRF